MEEEVHDGGVGGKEDEDGCEEDHEDDLKLIMIKDYLILALNVK